MDYDNCPICQGKVSAFVGMRTDSKGRYWCESCQTEHDSIDWDKVAEERLGM